MNMLPFMSHCFFFVLVGFFNVMFYKILDQYFIRYGQQCSNHINIFFLKMIPLLRKQFGIIAAKHCVNM